MKEEPNHLTVNEFIANQTSLEEEARNLMPWDPKKCTYNMGSIRQQVFACRTHKRIGVCYSCSIRCHTTCDLVELFTKRNFTCDCGTERDDRITEADHIRCEIRKNTADDIPAQDNKYGHNFDGVFCECAQEYDPDSPAVMLQCVMGLECDEDWYHDYCIMGVPENTATREDEKPNLDHKADEETETESVVERTLDGFPNLESFDSFICWNCVSKYDYYFKKLLSHELSDQLFSQKLSHKTNDTVYLKTETKTKDIDKKRSYNEISNSSDGIPYSLFLKSDYSEVLQRIKDSICDKNDKLFIFLDKLVPFLIKDDPVYEPNDEDEDQDGLDIFTLTRNLLQSSDNRAGVVQSIAAFQSLKSKLNNFLQPFADSGKIVKEDDIKTFFQESNQ